LLHFLCAQQGHGFSWWEAWGGPAEYKLGLTKTVINSGQQLSRSLVGIYR